MTPACSIAVLPGERPDRVLVKHFLAHLERTRQQHWCSLDFPEDRISWREAVQVIAMEETGRTTAIEHVPMEGLADSEVEWHRFEEAFAPISREASLQVDQYQIDVTLSVNLARTATELTLLAAGVRAWCARHLTAMREGASNHVTIIRDTPLQIHVDKVRCAGEPGRLLILRAESPRHFETMIHEQLQRKLGKLVLASADRHVLLFENSDGRWSAGQLRVELDAGVEFPDLRRLDEIWMADTTQWSQASLAFRLVLHNAEE
jgi:hypothetical protein